jgi:HAMP domain-containing protein
LKTAIALASYEDSEEFIERLPRYLNDVIRDVEARVDYMNATETTNQGASAEIRAAAKRFGRRTTPART